MPSCKLTLFSFWRKLPYQAYSNTDFLYRFHRFLDVNSHKVERTIEGWVMCLWINNGLVNFFWSITCTFFFFFLIRIHEKLIVHSDLGKAASWKRLTEKFLNSPLPSIEETKVRMLQFPSAFCTLLDAVGFYCNVMLEISDGLAVEFVVAVHIMYF